MQAILTGVTGSWHNGTCPQVDVPTPLEPLAFDFHGVRVISHVDVMRAGWTAIERRWEGRNPGGVWHLVPDHAANADWTASCVHACAGMEDPRAAIDGLRGALIALVGAVQSGYTRRAVDLAGLVENGRRALARANAGSHRQEEAGQ